MKLKMRRNRIFTVNDRLTIQGLSQKDAQSRNKWRRRIKGQPANPGSPGNRFTHECVKRSVCVEWIP